MRYARNICVLLCLCVATAAGMRFLAAAPAADHNDPNAVNSIFSDVDVSAADLYDLFGFPSDAARGEKVALALTFASVPGAGVFDTDLLYRILIAPGPRVAPHIKNDASLEILLKYFQAITKAYLSLKPSEVRVTVDKEGRANVDFMNFPGGSFTKVIETNKVVTLDAPGGHSIKAFIGGRDDAFFNDLPWRSRGRAATDEGTGREGCLKVEPYCRRPERRVPESVNDSG